MKKIIKWIFDKFGLSLTSSEDYKKLSLLRLDRASRDLEFLSELESHDIAPVLKLIPHSKSQLRQDLFVLQELNFLKNGFFVEFGASNGILRSNTYLLEQTFGWKGILAEPGRNWHVELRQNRPNASIEYSCVWKSSLSTILFTEMFDPELSTISEFINNDLRKDDRRNKFHYEVQTISLIDLLEKHNAPKHINYLSLDTEGSELEILKSFDFKKFTFDVITCEHNYSENREIIRQLLEMNGYRRIMEKLSEYDDWYVRDSIA